MGVVERPLQVSFEAKAFARVQAFAKKIHRAVDFIPPHSTTE
jgi:hypothetical protein